jgi:NADPH:quinone reductase-like Zn-dependent oxidoreductase
LTYSTVLEGDVAGEVAAEGLNVTRFKIGDRVLGNATGIVTKRLDGNGF